jgi:hypothetical protein
MVGNVIMSIIFIVGIFSMVMFFVDVAKSGAGTKTERDVLGLVGVFLLIIFGGGLIALIIKSIF